MLATTNRSMNSQMRPGPSQPAIRGEHLRELDGLRAIAIGAVFFFHLQVPGFSIGWSGVQLFFVISGFLITGILLRSRQRPHYFRNFYVRRTLRIFPIYYLLVVVYFGVAWFQGDRQTLGLIPYYLTYTQTYSQLASGFTRAPLLAHTWTLAIEEQFYLIWPLALFLLRGKWLVAALVACFALGLGTRVWAQGLVNPFLSLAWLPAQLDLFAAGAGIAVLSTAMAARSIRRWGYALATVGLVATGVIVMRGGAATFWTIKTWVYSPLSPYLSTAMATAFAGVVALAATRAPPLRWLANRPMMRIGKISYGLYLFHPYVFALVEHVSAPLHHAGQPMMEHHLIVVGIMAAKVAGAVIVAECSWRLFEGPINALKDRLARVEGGS
jgi:peptidoglycan/LPS O-acetylase OafA/YrhL